MIARLVAQRPRMIETRARLIRAIIAAVIVVTVGATSVRAGELEDLQAEFGALDPQRAQELLAKCRDDRDQLYVQAGLEDPEIAKYTYGRDVKIQREEMRRLADSRDSVSKRISERRREIEHLNEICGKGDLEKGDNKKAPECVHRDYLKQAETSDMGTLGSLDMEYRLEALKLQYSLSRLKLFEKLAELQDRCRRLETLAKLGGTLPGESKKVEEPAKPPQESPDTDKAATADSGADYKQDIAEARRNYREARALDLEGKTSEAADTYRVAMSLLAEAREKAASPQRKEEVEKAIERMSQRIAALPQGEQPQEERKDLSKVAQREAGQRQCESEFPNSVLIKPDPSGRYWCGCKSGYAWNAGRTACVKMSKQAVAQGACQKAYPNSVLSYIEADGTLQCGCPAGRVWNATRTACIRGASSQTFDPQTARAAGYVLGVLLGQAIRSKSSTPPQKCHVGPDGRIHCGSG